MSNTRSMMSVLEVETAVFGKLLNQTWYLVTDTERNVTLMRRRADGVSEALSEPLEKMDFVLFFDGLKKGLKLMKHGIQAAVSP